MLRPEIQLLGRVKGLLFRPLWKFGIFRRKMRTGAELTEWDLLKCMDHIGVTQAPARAKSGAFFSFQIFFLPE